jgi:hypothetical protein
MATNPSLTSKPLVFGILNEKMLKMSIGFTMSLSLSLFVIYNIILGTFTAFHHLCSTSRKQNSDHFKQR